MYRFASTTNKRKITTFCNIIKKHNLKLKRGGIQVALRHYKADVKLIGLVFAKNNPVGCCVLTNSGVMFGYNVSVYILPNYRRRGLGTKLLKHCLKRDPSFDMRAWTDSSASRNFYKDFI